MSGSAFRKESRKLLTCSQKSATLFTASHGGATPHVYRFHSDFRIVNALLPGRRDAPQTRNTRTHTVAGLQRKAPPSPHTHTCVCVCVCLPLMWLRLPLSQNNFFTRLSHHFSHAVTQQTPSAKPMDTHSRRPPKAPLPHVATAAPLGLSLIHI